MCTQDYQIKFGSAVHLFDLSGRNGYLDTRGRVLDKPEFNNRISEICFVSTHPSKFRDNGSGTWTLLSAEGKHLGLTISNGDKVHLLNMYPYAGYLDMCGTSHHFPSLQNLPKSYTVFTSSSPNRDQGTGVWTIESLVEGKPIGSPIEIDEPIRLRNNYREAGYLFSFGDVTSNPSFQEYNDTISFVLVGLEAIPQPNTDVWAMQKVEKN